MPNQPLFGAPLPEDQIASPSAIALQREMAKQMMAQGMDTSPIRSAWAGVARVVQAALGGYQARQVDQREQAARLASAQYLSRALLGGDPSAIMAAAAGPAGAWNPESAPMRAPRRLTKERDVADAAFEAEQKARTDALLKKQEGDIEETKQRWGSVRKAVDTALAIRGDFGMNRQAPEQWAQKILTEQQEAAIAREAQQLVARSELASKATPQQRTLARRLLDQQATLMAMGVTQRVLTVDDAIQLAQQQEKREREDARSLGGLDDVALDVRRVVGQVASAYLDSLTPAEKNRLGMVIAKRDVDAFNRQHPDLSDEQRQRMQAGLSKGRWQTLDQAYEATRRR